MGLFIVHNMNYTNAPCTVTEPIMTRCGEPITGLIVCEAEQEKRPKSAIDWACLDKFFTSTLITHTVLAECLQNSVRSSVAAS